MANRKYQSKYRVKPKRTGNIEFLKKSAQNDTGGKKPELLDQARGGAGYNARKAYGPGHGKVIYFPDAALYPVS